MPFKDDEMYIIRASITLPHVVKRIEASIAELEQRRNILNRAYTMVGWTVLQRAKQELYDARRGLSQLRIRVVDEGAVNGVPHYSAEGRGVHHRFGISPQIMSMEVSDHLDRMSAEVGEILKKR